jgi:hypothetical protein
VACHSDIADRITDALHNAGFTIERRDRHQPVASTTAAKLIHTLGFEQRARAYEAEVGSPPTQLDVHRRDLKRVRHDPAVTIARLNNTQYIAHRTTTRAPASGAKSADWSGRPAVHEWADQSAHAIRFVRCAIAALSERAGFGP